MAQKLLQSFYQRDTKLVARELLGKRLVHVVGGKRLSGIIVETEAYIGAEDPACHGFDHRKTKRTQSLYQDGGHSYVYFVYGMHCCFNIVTRDTQQPEAVLVRALEPSEGLKAMQRNRLVEKDILLTNGPGKLCEALAIDLGDDKLSLTGREIFIEKTDLKVSKKNIIASPRIGVDYAGDAAAWLLRFYIRDNPYVSRLHKKK